MPNYEEWPGNGGALIFGPDDSIEHEYDSDPTEEEFDEELNDEWEDEFFELEEDES